MNEVEDFLNGWHKETTKDHICIWSDQWIENYKKQQEKDDPSPDNP